MSTITPARAGTFFQDGRLQHGEFKIGATAGFISGGLRVHFFVRLSRFTEIQFISSEMTQISPIASINVMASMTQPDTNAHAKYFGLKGVM